MDERFPMHTFYLALGSNLGDSRELLRQARQALRESEGIEITASSFLYRSSAVGGPAGQRCYLNAVLKGETRLAPAALLGRFQEVENAFGRTRDVPWGPRTLDLDLLLFADQVVRTPALTLPHPRLHLRSFVLRPLHDLAPDLLHPFLRQPVSRLLAELAEPGEVVLLERHW